jgi:hypothetical protein
LVSWGSRERTDFFPIRIVTLIEVFTRSSVALLIDHDSPFAERASKLDVNIKFDFSLVRSLQGREVTLGQLMAHGISVQRIENMASVFSTLLGRDLFELISKVARQWEFEQEGDAAKPIITDLAETRKTLSRLFELRHVLVHEFPHSVPYTHDDIEQFLNASIDFMDATEEMLQTTLYGREPTHQRGRNAKAELEAKLVLQELAEVVQEIAKISKTKRIFRVQRKWEAFKHAEAERQSAIWGRRARMGPLIYHYAVKRLAKERVRELREWLKNEGISVLGPA